MCDDIWKWYRILLLERYKPVSNCSRLRYPLRQWQQRHKSCLFPILLGRSNLKWSVKIVLNLLQILVLGHTHIERQRCRLYWHTLWQCHTHSQALTLTQPFGVGKALNCNNGRSTSISCYFLKLFSQYTNLLPSLTAQLPRGGDRHVTFNASRFSLTISN